MMISRSDALFRGTWIARRARVALACILAITAGACSDSVGPDGEQDRIVFLSTRDANTTGNALRDIFVINADGSGIENLTRHPDDYSAVNITPDGRKLIFSASRGGCRRIWTMAIDGTGLKPVTDCADHPKLSPDGTRFAYLRGETVYVSNIDGSAPYHVAFALPPVGSGCGPTPQAHVLPLGWLSLDRVVFRRFICGAGATSYSVDTHGLGLTVLPFNAASAHLSPDMTLIAYDHTAEPGPFHLSVMNADGSGARGLVEHARLPNRMWDDLSPWSPDARQFYFYTETYNPATVVEQTHYVFDLTRGEARRIAGSEVRVSFGGWSPRGDRIAFQASAPGNATFDIYLMNADGSGVVNLTNHPSHNSWGVWVPR